MKCLNEPIARQANKEDRCTGHFFEGRFYSQALLTDEALLCCMAYVDLNPVRAGMADTPETSEHTSIKERIQPSVQLAQAVQEQIKQGVLFRDDFPLKALLHFDGSVTQKKQTDLLFFETDYLSLVDVTGRCIKQNKRSSINTQLDPILTRLGLDHQAWLQNASSFEAVYQSRFSRKRKRVDKQSA